MFLFPIALLLLFSVAPCKADAPLQQPWEITADRLIHEQSPETVTAEGDVVLLRRDGEGSDMEVRADRLFFSVADQYVHASGHVLLTTAEEKITAEEAEIFLSEEKGTLIRTSFQLPNNSLYFLGENVSKTGAYSYRFTEGLVTACPPRQGKSAPWAIHAKETDLTVEGYAVLRHATLRVKDVPLLYSPFLVLPAKTVRETGFLFPEISRSERDGAGIIVPFFVNLSASSDLTLYPGYLQERGAFMGMEFRYVADPRSQGSFSADYLHDTHEDYAGSDFNEDGYFRTTRDRYWLRGKADHVFAGEIKALLDFDLASDRDFVQEYREGIVGYEESNKIYFRKFHRGLQEASIPYRESSLQVMKSWPTYFTGLELLSIKDVWDSPSSVTPLQRLPVLTHDGALSLRSLPWPTRLVWEADYANYWRHEGVGAQRLQIEPALVTTLPLGNLFEGAVSLTGSETVYAVESYGDRNPQWPYDDFQTRTLWRFDSSLATSLSRTYRQVPGAWQSIRHLLRPELSYVYVPDKDQNELPDLDMEDRISKRNWLRFGITNFLRVAEEADSGLQSRKLATFNIEQTFNIGEARRDLLPGESRKAFSDVLLELDFYPQEDFSIAYDTTVSVHGQGVTGYELGMHWRKNEIGMLSANYLYDQNDSREQPFFYATTPGNSQHSLNLSGEFGITEQIVAKGNVSHSFTDEKSRETRLQLTYAPSCWAVETSFTKTLNDNRVAVVFSLAGLGKLLDVGLSEF